MPPVVSQKHQRAAHCTRKKNVCIYIFADENNDTSSGAVDIFNVHNKKKMDNHNTSKADEAEVCWGRGRMLGDGVSMALIRVP